MKPSTTDVAADISTRPVVIAANTSVMSNPTILPANDITICKPYHVSTVRVSPSIASVTCVLLTMLDGTKNGRYVYVTGLIGAEMNSGRKGIPGRIGTKFV